MAQINLASDPIALALLARLRFGHPRTFKQLRVRMDECDHTIYRRLQTLEDEYLITVECVGRTTYYKIDPTTAEWWVEENL